MDLQLRLTRGTPHDRLLNIMFSLICSCSSSSFIVIQDAEDWVDALLYSAEEHQKYQAQRRNSESAVHIPGGQATSPRASNRVEVDSDFDEP